jgi:UDP-glucose 4-epimerase
MTLALGIDSKPAEGEERPGEIERSSLNPLLAEKILGWKPETSLKDGIHSTLEWFKLKRQENP